MTSLVFYEEVVPLNEVLHKDLGFDKDKIDYSFASKTNSVVVNGPEFAALCKEYPIVFSQVSPDKIVPVVLLGLRNDENLFVNEKGEWQGRTIPGFVNRYPFVMAELGEDEKWTLCFDQTCSRIGKDKGDPLFNEEGEKTPLLERIIQLVMAYQAQYSRTENFVTHLKNLDLLTPFTGAIQLKDGQKVGLKNLLIVDEKKLLQLEKDKAHAIMRSGELSWVYSHLISLSNFTSLGDKLSERD